MQPLGLHSSHVFGRIFWHGDFGTAGLYSERVKTGTPMQRLRRKSLRSKKEVKASTLMGDRAIARAERQLAKANRKLNQR
jgi:hypothetical protein